MADIRSQKNGKVLRQDSLNAEPFKIIPDIVAVVLQTLFEAIWNEEQLSYYWTDDVTVRISIRRPARLQHLERFAS